ncbi:MAG: DUF4157 domain-containing protein [Sporocytophaga sp.]|uniref:eCIS core domain-containing protein n=1 Tax=Sporocytophaga sp. TaxID=2231183 RepID=UPI001B192C9B|nr:DUF4157 domain-containing protein [Sporocytophaga sp.]MBO9701820.1 DUF4157 domain-containing protein [Sporocytophaga sp.]
MIVNSRNKKTQFSKQNETLSSQGKSINELNAQNYSVNNQLLGISNNSDSEIQKKETNTNDNSFSAMPNELQAKMENSFSSDFSNVKIHKESNKASQMGAHAFTQGNDIHFAPGKFDPSGNSGQQLLAHELTHVVQQRNGKVNPTAQLSGISINNDPTLEKEADIMGAKAIKGEKNFSAKASSENNNVANVVQGFFTQTHKTKPYKVADDLSLAVEVGYPNHILFAKAGMAATANTKLNAVGSGIELQETSTSDTFSNGSKSETLKQVLPKNKKNSTQGTNMNLWADCGKSNAEVVGGSSRKAAYKDGGALKWTAAGSPAEMKSEIMKNWLTKKYNNVSTPSTTKMQIKSVLDAAKVIDSNMAKQLDAYGKAKTDKERETIADKYFSLQDEKAEKLWEYYNGLPTTSKESIDKELAINRYAKPTIGEGYTTSSGGTPVAGYENNTWNFHWGGVVLESTDTSDKVVLENYAVGDASVENDLWEFAMYGTSKKGQTFHDVHSDTNQHGTSPTTMRINKA